MIGERLDCAGCGCVTSIPPLCAHCFSDIGARSPIVPSNRRQYDYAVRTDGCVQHVTREQLSEWVANARSFGS